jgi:hypothetical protein
MSRPSTTSALALLGWLGLLGGGLQAQQIVFHPDLALQQSRNSAFKTLSLNLAAEQTRRIEEHRRAVLGHLATLERIEHQLHRSLTEVQSALSDGRTVYHIARRVPRIMARMQEALQLAAAKPQLLPAVHREANLAVLRLSDLVGYLNRALLQGDGRTLIDPARRGELVRKVHDELRVTEALAEQIVATLRVSRLQDAVDAVIPFQDRLQADRTIIQSILSRWNP